MNRVEMVGFGLVLIVFASGKCLAQSAASATEQAGPTISKFDVPAYPPMARVARVMGDVELQLNVKSDGTVELVSVVGPPLLAKAAAESARKSEFLCRNCGDTTKSVSLRYTFKIVEGKTPTTMRDCVDRNMSDPLPAEVDVVRRQVTISVWLVWICDPAARRVHAAKCLWLWKCGEVVER